MGTGKGFTLIELLVVVAILAVLMATILPALHRVREYGKRAVCLGNLKQLQLAWAMYADENEGKIVNGDAGDLKFWGPLANQNEPAWVGECTTWSGSGYQGTHLAKPTQQLEIMSGALWPYVRELKVYRCPMGSREELLSYAVSSAMNGGPEEGTCDNIGGRPVPKKQDGVWLWLKRLDQIGRPGERMVFVDEGWATTIGPYAVRYLRRAWWDGPPLQHGDGGTLTFADGHAEYWKWKADETIKLGRQIRDIVRVGLTHDYVPKTEEGDQDLWRMQRATWGKLGYDPMKR